MSPRKREDQRHWRQRLHERFGSRDCFAGDPAALNILPAASGEDSYGLSVCFPRWLRRVPPTTAYFSGGPRRGFTFGLPAHRSLGQRSEERRVGKEWRSRWARCEEAKDKR